MHKIINKTNSPFDLVSKSGPIRLPPMGEVSGEFDPGYLACLEASLAVEVVSGHAKPDHNAVDNANRDEDGTGDQKHPVAVQQTRYDMRKPRGNGRERYR